MRRKDAYSPEEDKVILSSRSTETAYRRLRGRRTRAALSQRRWMLRNPEPKPLVVQDRMGQSIWTADEKAILKREWPLAQTTKDIARFLPRFTNSQMRSKAAHMGLKRWFNGAPDVPINGHLELVDQIRIRSKQDGIALRKLDKLLGCNYYFGTSNWRRTRINLVHVARAIEFFGGTLVIDWCDR